MKTFLRKIFAAWDVRPATAPPLSNAGLVLDTTPDKPGQFGCKVNWFAVKADAPISVLEALNLGSGSPANWASGLEAAYRRPTGTERPLAFISPSVRGWVFVVGSFLPVPVADSAQQPAKADDPFRELMTRLAHRFDDVQYFGNYRVVGMTIWARSVNGQLQRLFGYYDGEVYANYGEQSAEEKQLGFPDLSGLTPQQAEDRLFEIAEQQSAQEEELVRGGLSPLDASADMRRRARSALPDEEDVIDIARLWSLDPERLAAAEPASGIGTVIELPRKFAQV